MHFMMGLGPRARRMRKVKLADKKGALDSLAKTLGMFQEATPAKPAEGVTIQLVVLPAGKPMPEQVSEQGAVNVRLLRAGEED